MDAETARPDPDLLGVAEDEILFALPTYLNL